MWEVLSFADKPYKGLSKAKVVLVMIVMVVMISLTRDLSNTKLITMIIIVMVMLIEKNKGKREIEDEQLHDGASDKLPSTQ